MRWFAGSQKRNVVTIQRVVGFSLSEPTTISQYSSKRFEMLVHQLS